MIERPIAKLRERAVASMFHTLGLLLAILLLAIAALRSPVSEWPGTLASPDARLLLYLRILIVQWMLVGYIWLGIRRSQTTLRRLIDDSRWTFRRWLLYLAVGLGGFILYLVVGNGLSAMLNPNPEALRGVQAMLPHTSTEKGLWAAFALTAGVSEEVVYRGYLLRQFHALTGSALLALVLQALCYTMVHIALPLQMLVGVIVLGLLLGGLAVWQKSLVPGMILHVAVGLVALLQPA